MKLRNDHNAALRYVQHADRRHLRFAILGVIDPDARFHTLMLQKFYENRVDGSDDGYRTISETYHRTEQERQWEINRFSGFGFPLHVFTDPDD